MAISVNVRQLTPEDRRDLLFQRGQGNNIVAGGTNFSSVDDLKIIQVTDNNGRISELVVDKNVPDEEIINTITENSRRNLNYISDDQYYAWNLISSQTFYNDPVNTLPECGSNNGELNGICPDDYICVPSEISDDRSPGGTRFVYSCQRFSQCASKENQFIGCDPTNLGNAFFYSGRTISEDSNTCEIISRRAISNASLPESQCFNCKPLENRLITCVGNGIGTFYTGRTTVDQNTNQVVCETTNLYTDQCITVSSDCQCFSTTSYKDKRNGQSYPATLSYIPCNKSQRVERSIGEQIFVCAVNGTTSIAPNFTQTFDGIPLTALNEAQYITPPQVNSGGRCITDGECLPPPPPPPPAPPTPVPTLTPILVTPTLTAQTPTPTPTIQTPTPTPTPTWRSCVDGSVNNGAPPSSYRQSIFIGAGGGTCWEPTTSIGFDPDLNRALNFLYKRGSSQYPTSVTIKITNPSYTRSYNIKFTTNPDILVNPKTLTITPRSTESIIINVTPALYDKLSDGVSTIGMDVDVTEI